MADERLAALKWHHLKVELDDRKKEWPGGSKYEIDQETHTVTWYFEEQSQAPPHLVQHLSNDDLWSPKPSEIVERLVRQANKVSKWAS